MIHQITFSSTNGRDTVHGWIAEPSANSGPSGSASVSVCAPKAVVQLVHGFNEHSGRYSHMVSRFLEAGYIVAADDHVGHGRTAKHNPLPAKPMKSGETVLSDSRGNWGNAGHQTMMEDEYILTGIIREHYPDLPLFLYGHSLGSLIVRDYSAKYGRVISGLILCGTAGVYPVPEDVIAELDAAIAAGRGEETAPDLFRRVMGWRNERCGEIIYGNEWICTDKEVQKAHASDPLGTPGALVTMQALRYYLEMFRAVEGPDWAAQVPREIPVYNIAGSEDPVGTYGKGVRQVHTWLEETGHTVTTRIYEGCRHEIHSEPEIREDVVRGIVEFMDGVLKI